MGYFCLALVVLPIEVGLRSLRSGPFSVEGAVLFVLLFAAVAGIWGTFSDDVRM
jgi:hypothetical protein